GVNTEWRMPLGDVEAKRRRARARAGVGHLQSLASVRTRPCERGRRACRVRLAEDEVPPCGRECRAAERDEERHVADRVPAHGVAERLEHQALPLTVLRPAENRPSHGPRAGSTQDHGNGYDIAYSESPAASRASAGSTKFRIRMIRPLSSS